MIAYNFDYKVANSMEEAFSMLAEAGLDGIYGCDFFIHKTEFTAGFLYRQECPENSGHSLLLLLICWIKRVKPLLPQPVLA